MTKEELSELRLIKNEPCVSIIVPTGGDPTEHTNDFVEVDSAVNTAIRILIGKYGEEKAHYLLNKLKRVVASIDYVDESEGLGIFLSKDISKVIRFQFPVTEKVFVGDEFETRDLLYSTKSLFNYYFLLLNKNVTRLFKGYGDMIAEVIDENYPKYYVGNDFRDELNLSGIYSSAQEKSNSEDRKIRTLLQNVDYLLFLYLSRNTPLFVGGTQRWLRNFEHITKYSSNVVGLVEGDFEKHSVNELRSVMKNELKKHAVREGEMIIKSFQETIGSGKVIWGIAAIWKAAIEGRVVNLLVEKDYMCKAMITADRKKIYFNVNVSDKNLIELDDAVNDLIEIVIEKGGDIIFIENGKLTKYDKIAAILSN